MTAPSHFSGNFEIDVDPTASRIVLHPTGHWSLETVDRLDAAFQDLIARLRPSGRPLRLLIDLRDRTAHPQDVAVRLQASFARMAPSFERVAIVMPRSAIMVMQAKRIATESSSVSDHQRQFGPDEVEAARGWLDADLVTIETARAA
jgi:hypothetical protein